MSIGLPRTPDGCPPRTPPEVEPDSYEIDIGSAGDDQFLGWGWHRQESIFDVTIRWIGEYPQTQLFVDLPPGDYEVTVSAQAFWEPRELRLLANSVPIGDPVQVMPDSLQQFTFALPASLVGDGKHITITLDYDNVIVPEDVEQSEDGRPLAVSVDRLHFRRLQ